MQPATIRVRLSLKRLSRTDCEVQRRIEREVRIREGACKLLAACSQRDQALEASKTLLTSNIYGMWRNLHAYKISPFFTDFLIFCPFFLCSELHQCAVFCLLQVRTEIHDTDLVIADRTLTDICFDEPVIFTAVPPGFDLRVELYSFHGISCSSHSSGTRSGERSPRGESPVLLPVLSVRVPKYHLLAHTSLTLCHVQNSFRTHDLTIADTEESSFWLPLYGNVCCRLVAQPLCMTQIVMCGKLRIRVCKR
uniref:Rhotekin 2b n=1 Tax=Sinocyclocheilus grahami TaxID=75366 RepID=A0A672SA31_SINGR